MQLVTLNFVASDQTSAKELDRACKTNLIDQVEMLQKPMSDPNVRGPRGCFFRTHSHRSGWPRLEVVQLGVVAFEMLRLLVENGANIDVPLMSQ